MKGDEAEAARASSGRGLAPAPAAGGLREGLGKPRLPAERERTFRGHSRGGWDSLECIFPLRARRIRCSGRVASSFRGGKVGGD